MSSRLAQVSTVLLGGLTMAGCASYIPEAAPGTPERRAQLELVVQVCLPVTSTATLPSASSVVRYGTHGELRSSGTWNLERIASTQSGQPVFEPNSSVRQADFMGLVVLSDYRYVFTVADNALTASWTDWKLPSSRHSVEDSVANRLARDEPIRGVTPDASSPRVRYRVVPLVEYFAPRQRSRLGTREKIPSC